MPQPVTGRHTRPTERWSCLGPLVVGLGLLSGGVDSLEGPGFDRQPAPPHNHRLVRIQGLREPLAPK